MRRKPGILLALLILCVNALAANMELSGAATSAVNGMYIETGASDGVPKYVHESNGIILHRVSYGLTVLSQR